MTANKKGIQELVNLRPAVRTIGKPTRVRITTIWPGTRDRLAWKRFLDEHEIYEHHTVYPMVETFLVAAVTLGHKTLRTLRHKTMGPKRRDVTPVRKKNYNSKREDNKGEDQPEDERNVIL